MLTRKKHRALLYCFAILLACGFVYAENIGLMSNGGIALSSQVIGNSSAEDAFDGTSAHCYLRVLPETYIIREWEQDAVIEEIEVQFLSGRMAVDFDLYVWQYGQWLSVGKIRGNEDINVTIPVGGLRTRKLLYKALKFVNPNYNNVREIVVTGTLLEPFVPQPEDFAAERRDGRVFLRWEAPWETGSGAAAVGYNVLKTVVVDGEYGEWEVVAADLKSSSWTGSDDPSQSIAYSVVGIDKWGYTSEMAPPVVIPAAGNVAGLVVDENANPVAGALVKIEALGITATTDSRGSFAIYNLPVGTWQVEVLKEGYIRGEQTIEVAAAGTAELEITLFQGEEIPARPSYLAVSQLAGKIKLEWPATDGAFWYNIYRSETPGIDRNSTPPLAAGVAGTSWIDITALPGQVYYYAVSAVSRTFHESELSPEEKASCLSPAKTVLLEPNQYEVIHDRYVVMRWEPLSDVDYYLVEYSRSARFPETETKRKKVRGAAQLIDPALEDGNWYWRVQAYFEDGSVSGFSETGTFSVVRATGSAPIAFFDLWPKVVGQAQFVNVHYILNLEDLLVSARVYDLNGRCVKTFFENHPASSGHHEFSWNGLGDDRRPLKNGVYIMQLVAAKTGHKYEVRKKILVMN